MAQVESSQVSNGVRPPAYFKEALEDAERLLKYSAEIGIEDIDPDTRSAILHAREVFHSGWTEDVADKLLVALARLAARLKPVTAASLKASHYETRPTMHVYLVWAILLSAIIIPSSIVTFITSNISQSISADIVKTDALAVKLSTELGPPERPDVGLSEKIADLQEYASTVRAIFRRAQRLNRYVFPHVPVPLPLERPQESGSEKPDWYQISLYQKQKFELPVPLTDLPEARNRMTSTYQDVRFFDPKHHDRHFNILWSN